RASDTRPSTRSTTCVASCAASASRHAQRERSRSPATTRWRSRLARRRSSRSGSSWSHLRPSALRPAPRRAGSVGDWIVFWIVAPISIASAVAMVLSRNAVHAALLLILNLFTIAVFFLTLGSDFLFVVQIIVYAGA